MERAKREPAGKPAGGFVFIPVRELCRAWAAYQERRIRLVDLRTWFACHELAARRCRLPGGRATNFREAELHGLVGGVGGEHTRASLRRLEAATLVRWTAHRIEFLKAEGAEETSTALAHLL